MQSSELSCQATRIVFLTEKITPSPLSSYSTLKNEWCIAHLISTLTSQMSCVKHHETILTSQSRCIFFPVETKAIKTPWNREKSTNKMYKTSRNDCDVTVPLVYDSQKRRCIIHLISILTSQIRGIKHRETIMTSQRRCIFFLVETKVIKTPS